MFVCILRRENRLFKLLYDLFIHIFSLAMMVSLSLGFTLYLSCSRVLFSFLSVYVSVCEGVCVFVFVCQQSSSFGVGRLTIFGNSCTEM